MTAGNRQLSPISLLLRAAALFGLFLLVVLLPAVVTDPGLRQVIPPFGVMILAQIGPVVFTRTDDLFAPLILGGVRAAFMSLGTLLSFVLAGELRLDILDYIESDALVKLTEKTIFASLLGIGATYVGYYGIWGRSLMWIFPRVAGIPWPRRRLILLCIPPLVGFVLAYSAFQAKLGVSIFDPTQLAAGKAVWRDDPMLSWMLRGIELGFIPLIFFFAMRATSPRRFALVLPAAVALVAGLLVTRLGQRGPFFYAILSAAVVIHYLRHRLPVWGFVVVMFVGMTISNVLVELRLAEPETPTADIVANVSTNPMRVLAAHETERQRFASMALVLDSFPDKVPYLLGESWLPIFVAPIPRWLWPEKTELFAWQDNRIVFQLSGVPAPTPLNGVLYANLSWLGLIAGNLLMGILYRSLYEWLKRNPRDPNVVVIYALLLIYVDPSFLGLSTMVQYVVPAWVIISVLGWAHHKRAGA